jgi:hypothetical protein
MGRIFCAFMVTLFRIAPLQALGAADNKTQAAPISRSLLNSLREGGYILYARRGEATVGEDQPNLNFQDCSTQRNLSKAGKRQAAAYGRALRGLRIPTQSPVHASPFCRTRITAELAFREENVEVDPFWVEIFKLSGDLSAAEQERILNSLRSALEIQPPPGRNKVITSFLHHSN